MQDHGFVIDAVNQKPPCRKEDLPNFDLNSYSAKHSLWTLRYFIARKALL